MMDLAAWLVPYRRFLGTEAFLGETAPRTASSDEATGANEFFRDLLAPIHDLQISTNVWTTFFSTDTPLQELEMTSEAATTFLLRRIAEKPEVSGAEAAKLAEAFLKAGKVRASGIAAAVAYLAGNRSITALSLLFGACIRDTQLQAGEEVLEEAETLFPDSIEVRFCRSILLVSQGHAGDAAPLLKALATEHPHYGPAWRLLLGALLAEKRWDAAVQEGNLATRHHPLDPILWEGFAEAWRNAGDARAAMEALQNAIACVDRSVGIDPAVRLRLQLQAAGLKEEMGKIEDALQVYRTLLDNGSTAAAIFLNLSSCLKAAGRTPEALSALRHGLRVHPADPDLLTNLGEILFEKREDEEAFAVLQRAGEERPEHLKNIFLMAAISLRHRRFDQAIELASSVARADPSLRPEALTLVGDAYRFLARAEAALEAYQAALECAPHNRDIENRIRDIKENALTH